MKFNEQLKINKTPENENLPSKEDESNHLKNIEEVFKLNPELENIAVEAIKSGKTIPLYRIENKNIEKEPDGITSHKDLKGQWFTPDLETALVYLRKSQQTFGTEANRVEGANLVVVKIPKEEFENLHVSKHPIASQMDVENDNYIIPEKIERNYISLDDVQDKVGKFENLQKAKEQIKEKVKQFESKEAIKLYQEYLKTIFPESKFKEIFYHGSDNKFESFLSPGKDGYEKKYYNPTGSAGIYFSNKLNYAEQYVGRTGRGLKNKNAKGYIYPVLVDIKNPLTVSERYDDGLTPNTHLMTKLWNIDKNFLEHLNSNNYDGVVSGKFLRDTRGQNEIAVLNSDQIHILGNKQDIEKFKEFISKNENEMQSIDEISFEEVSPDTSDSIEIKVYKDDSEETVLKKLKEKLIEENWWLKDEFKNEGIPKEQFIINGNHNEYSIYNFNNNLSVEQHNLLIRGISFIENSNETSLIKEITILIRKTEKINSDSGQPSYGNNYSDSKVINIYPRALKNESYREIPEISGLEATIVHEFSHPIYSKMEQKLRQEWFDFGWEPITEEERKNENMYAIKPKGSNKCVTEYAQFAPDEDFCESVVGLYAQSSKLDSEKKAFLENNIFNDIENISLVKITRKEKVELPKLPENIKFHKKEVSKNFIIRK